MKVVMVGSGYVGLVSGVCFADFGHSVICVDKDPDKIALLQSGGVPIYEPGLDDLIKKNVEAGRLTFSTDLKKSMEGANLVFIAVGTPERKDNGMADLKYVYAAAEEIGQNIKDFTVVVNKSTVPVGTGDEVHDILSQQCSDSLFSVVSNPEFLREGAAISDFKLPDRVVIGVQSEKAQAVMTELYLPLVRNETPIVYTQIRTAELIKYAANAFLATKIGFINEIANMCEKVGADVQQVSKGIGLDSRIGSKFLNAGPGYGGSCFPKDTIALVRSAEAVGAELSIVRAVVSSNAVRKSAMAEKVIAMLDGDVSGKNVAVLGLAFKPGTDDMREAPSITIINHLHKNGAKITAFDPEAMEEARHVLPQITYAQNAYECLEGADIAVIVTEWEQFRALDLLRVKDLLKQPKIIDLRNIYAYDIMEEFGIEYDSIGRLPKSSKSC